MSGKHPLKEVLMETIPFWNHAGMPPNVRENFWKIINCGTLVLGAEVYASATEWKLVCHTCKSRFCPSCGARAADLWQEELEASLPDIPYVGINFTMPRVFWQIFQQNRRLLHDIPAIGAAAIQFLAKARHGVRVIVMVVQQTFGGFLNFYPHLHTLVSAGGLDESNGNWVTRLKFDKRELMLAWRYALLTYLDEAIKANVLRSDLSKDELKRILEAEHKRNWNIFIGRSMSKTTFANYAGRYIRRPPIAQRRLTRITEHEVEYQAKDTREKRFVVMRYSNEAFVATLMPHVPDRSRNSMRYFGLLAPRSKSLLSAIFVLLGQKRSPRPSRLGWAESVFKISGTNPRLDSRGQLMYPVGRLNPIHG